MGAARAENLLNLVLLAEVLFADVVDLEAVFRGELFGIVLDGISQRFDKRNEVKDADASPAEVSSHASSIGNDRQGALDHNTVVAGDHACNVLLVPFDESGDCHRSTSE